MLKHFLSILYMTPMGVGKEMVSSMANQGFRCVRFNEFVQSEDYKRL